MTTTHPIDDGAATLDFNAYAAMAAAHGRDVELMPEPMTPAEAGPLDAWDPEPLRAVLRTDRHAAVVVPKLSVAPPMLCDVCAGRLRRSSFWAWFWRGVGVATLLFAIALNGALLIAIYGQSLY